VIFVIWGPALKVGERIKFRTSIGPIYVGPKCIFINISQKRLNWQVVQNMPLFESLCIDLYLTKGKETYFMILQCGSFVTVSEHQGHRSLHNSKEHITSVLSEFKEDVSVASESRAI
jgi:hypothetical protein